MARQFDRAGDLLKRAHELVDEAARVIAAESAKAPHLTRQPLSFATSSVRPPALMAMEELTKMSVEVAEIANQLGHYGAWMQYEGEPHSGEQF